MDNIISEGDYVRITERWYEILIISNGSWQLEDCQTGLRVIEPIQIESVEGHLHRKEVDKKFLKEAYLYD